MNFCLRLIIIYISILPASDKIIDASLLKPSQNSFSQVLQNKSTSGRMWDALHVWLLSSCGTIYITETHDNWRQKYSGSTCMNDLSLKATSSSAVFTSGCLICQNLLFLPLYIAQFE